MKSISNDEALRKLTCGGLNMAYEVEELEWAIKNDNLVLCYEHDNMMLVSDNDGEFVTVVPFNDTIDVDVTVNFILENYSKTSILVNTQRLSEKTKKELDDRLGCSFTLDRVIKDYAWLGNSVSTEDNSNIRMLGEYDAERFSDIEDEHALYRPPLEMLFDIFVMKKEGSILGIFEENSIIGYLSFESMGNKYYDLDYIYVIPDRRKGGIGKKLGEAYVKYAVGNNRIPYWSNARNAASAKTALSCGLSLVRSVSKYVVNAQLDR